MWGVLKRRRGRHQGGRGCASTGGGATGSFGGRERGRHWRGRRRPWWKGLGGMTVWRFGGELGLSEVHCTFVFVCVVVQADVRRAGNRFRHHASKPGRCVQGKRFAMWKRALLKLCWWIRFPFGAQLMRVTFHGEGLCLSGGGVDARIA